MKIPLGTKSIDVWKKQPTADGQGHKSVRTGGQGVRLVCEIDEAKLLAMFGEKAARNGKGVTQIGHGAIKIRVVERWEID